MDKDIAIRVENVSKTFRIPHEKVDTLRGAFVNVFRRKTYEKFKAVDGVSFEVKKGEFFGIIGRNGSGKSTLLKLLAGIYTPDSGKIKTNGLISPFLELGIGFNPELSGRDNIFLNASVLGMAQKEIEKKFDDIVAFSELERFIDQKLKNYSSGMQVRLAFSVATHANRDILLLDEVLAVGDANFQSKCLEEFNKYHDSGKTVILVTHNIAIVQRYCNRAMLIRDGKIMKIGNADEVGSEYIYQNMSDEEKRIIQVEKHREKEENKKKIEAEYAFERMRGKEKEDENKRIEEEKKKKEEERKNKVAKIIKVIFLDKEGKNINVFQTGDDISIRVYFKKIKPVDNLNFGVTIHNLENDYFFGINTFIDRIDIEKCIKDGYFQINFFEIPLKTDSYFVKAGIFGENEMKNYDFLQRSKTFKVISKSRSHGSVEIKYNWE